MNIGTILTVLAIGAAVIVAGLLFVIAYNHLPISDKDEYDRVVFIPGIKTPPGALVLWKHFLDHHYPKAEKEFIEGRYHYRDIESVVDIQERSVKALNKPGKTVVIVHSYGGLHIVAALQNNPELYENVVRIIAMAPAFDPTFNDLQASKDAIKFEHERVDVPMNVTCGVLDSTVPCKSTVLPGAKDNGKVFGGHSMFLIPQVFGGRKILQ